VISCINVELKANVLEVYSLSIIRVHPDDRSVLMVEMEISGTLVFKPILRQFIT
jgi:hypothetical protein